ncbi:phytosulfokines 1-like [Populus nigra]|uniref:phytosulfokines 1-like n=1 Tax=Populus nigra TaxID=3691 RepID=UPI002B265219|nr:phytosulfokines 1-like [Populus nigra]
MFDFWWHDFNAHLWRSLPLTLHPKSVSLLDTPPQLYKVANLSIAFHLSPLALPALITKMPRKLTFLMMVLFLLFSGAKSRSISASTRPESTPPETSSHIPAGSSPGESSINDEGYSCSGLESEEECLIRRSMADHTDYIYTQDISGP